MNFLTEYFPMIFRGFLLTVQMTFFGAIVGLLIGIILAIGDMYGGKPISAMIKIYVEFFRGSPLIVQLFIFYYSIPNLLNVLLNNYTVGLMVFALNSAAYQKGYIKGAMESVFEDQMTAALSLGLSKVQAIRYVVLPQALRIVIPSWSNEFSSLAKSTAALLVIALPELTSALKSIASWTWRILETYAFGAVIYLLWISVVMKILDIIYKKVQIPELEIIS
jgi:polar amino acid transport system permease protein